MKPKSHIGVFIACIIAAFINSICCWYMLYSFIIFYIITIVVCIIILYLDSLVAKNHEEYLKKLWEGYCINCGYPMHMSKSVNCPECGWPDKKM